MSDSVTLSIEMARQQLRDQGWTVIPDEPSFRVSVNLGFVGKYSSHYDPDLRAIVVVLHSKLREVLGI